MPILYQSPYHSSERYHTPNQYETYQYCFNIGFAYTVYINKNLFCFISESCIECISGYKSKPQQQNRPNNIKYNPELFHSIVFTYKASNSIYIDKLYFKPITITLVLVIKR